MRNARTTGPNPALTVAASLLLLAVLSWLPSPALAADVAEPQPIEAPPGSTHSPAPEPLEVELMPPKEVDGLEELNPVDQESLEALASMRSSDDPIFEKYAFLPYCTLDGCPGGIDHLAAGTGTRNAGYGTIRLRGVPPGATPASAFLYWSTIQTNGPIAFNQTVLFNGAAVTGSFIGSAPQPCWNSNGITVAYRASVLGLLNPGINSDYPVGKLPSNLTNGQNPWGLAGGNTTLPLSQGASLVVLYSHQSVPTGTWVQIHHPITQTTQVSGTFNYTHLLNLPIAQAAVKHTRIAADGQVGGGLANSNGTTNERTFIAGPGGTPFVQIKGNGSYGQGSEDSDLNGDDGVPLNQLWDTQTMNIPNTIAPGPAVTSYQVRYAAQGDCVIPEVHVLTAR